jgi:hypothetical protein
VDLGLRLGDRWPTLRTLLATGSLADAEGLARKTRPRRTP